MTNQTFNAWPAAESVRSAAESAAWPAAESVRSAAESAAWPAAEYQWMAATLVQLIGETGHA
jgi:hypothetical protein